MRSGSGLGGGGGGPAGVVVHLATRSSRLFRTDTQTLWAFLNRVWPRRRGRARGVCRARVVVDGVVVRGGAHDRGDGAGGRGATADVVLRPARVALPAQPQRARPRNRRVSVRAKAPNGGAFERKSRFLEGPLLPTHSIDVHFVLSSSLRYVSSVCVRFGSFSRVATHSSAVST